MGQKTTILMSLSVATAIHSVPCFEHYYRKAIEAGLHDEEIREAVTIARKVKNGADLALRKGISKIERAAKKPHPVEPSKQMMVSLAAGHWISQPSKGW